MAYEAEVLGQLLCATLGSACAAVSLGGTPVHSPLAPEGATFPYYRYDILSALDDNAIPIRRVHTMYVAQVVACTQGRSASGGTPSLFGMMNAVDTLLQGVSVVYGGQKFDIYRRRQRPPHAYIQVGVPYIEVAGEYVVLAQPT